MVIDILFSIEAMVLENIVVKNLQRGFKISWIY